jgi:starch phosphorylase
MVNTGRVTSPVCSSFPTDVEGFDAPAELAPDMRWSWNHSAEEVWKAPDPALWELTSDPWAILQAASRDQLERALADPDFRDRMDGLIQARRREVELPAWFQQNHQECSYRLWPTSVWSSC